MPYQLGPAFVLPGGAFVVGGDTVPMGGTEAAGDPLTLDGNTELRPPAKEVEKGVAKGVTMGTGGTLFLLSGELRFAGPEFPGKTKDNCLI